jgi:hypothetical protein
MLKNTFLFAAFFLLFAACNDTVGQVSEPEVINTMSQSAIPEVPELKGDNWVIKVVDGTIKSPRKELIGTIAEVPLVINYGSPAVNERTIYGDLVPYNKVWRTGANEATRITFQQDVMVGEANKKLAAGTYALFTLPSSKDEWTVIFNKVADQWGAYDYEEGADAARIKGMAKPNPARAERMNFALDGNAVQLMWVDLVIAFPVASAGK